MSLVFLSIFSLWIALMILRFIDICYKLESFKLLSFSKHKNIVYKDSLLKDWIRTAFWLLLRPVSPRYFANKIEKEIQKYSRDNGQYMAFIPSKSKEKEVFPSGTFDKTINLPFENLSLPAPEKFDTILNTILWRLYDPTTRRKTLLQSWISRL